MKLRLWLQHRFNPLNLFAILAEYMPKRWALKLAGSIGAAVRPVVYSGPGWRGAVRVVGGLARLVLQGLAFVLVLLVLAEIATIICGFVPSLWR